MPHPHLMTSPADIERFLYAGHAIITLSSLRTGAHYTFEVCAATDQQPDGPERTNARYFVKVLTDGDKYVYVGMICPGIPQANFRLTKASRMTDDSPVVKTV